MKRTRTLCIIALIMIMLLTGLCACAGRQPAANDSSDKETALASNAQTETHPDTEPSQTQPDTEPQETQTTPQAPDGQGTKTVSLTLPFMQTEDCVSFWPEDGAQSASLSLEIPADWTEDMGLFYCPLDGGVRKVLEPVCLLRKMDDAKWENLTQFDLTQPDGETEYLSVTHGVDANGREYIQLLGKSWPEGGTISVWYPCFCYLRDTNGSVVVLTYYLLDPEDQAAKEELWKILNSIRME